MWSKWEIAGNNRRQSISVLLCVVGLYALKVKNVSGVVSTFSRFNPISIWTNIGIRRITDFKFAAIWGEVTRIVHRTNRMWDQNIQDWYLPSSV